jgi:DNA mismatch repair protein MSH5
VSILVRPENQKQCDDISNSLKKINNMRRTMTMLRKGIDGGKQTQNPIKSGVWSSILEFCYNAIGIADTLSEVFGLDSHPLYARAAAVFDGHSLQRIGRTVDNVVDLATSADQQRTVVKRGVDSRLDGIKDLYDSMDDILNQKAIEIARDMPPSFTYELNAVYWPYMGCLLTVPLDERTGRPVYDGVNEGWQRIFSSEQQVYFKDDTMREMDHEVGDLYAEMCELEIEFAYDLAQKVLEDEELLVAASDLCGELDSSLAFSHVARKYNLTRPKMTEDNIIDIKGGRHLLQELTAPSFVPNDTLLVGGGGQDDNAPVGPSMMLLTGPNYSGKSVYQKQVAVAVYMAQIGSFVPADRATIGITDKIFTRITTKETVSKVQSAFMIDMQQIAIALNSCTRRSLLVIDEFGKGTDTCDGAGLAAGVIQHLLSLEAEAPKALVATHFHEIFELGLFNEARNISVAHMEVRVDDSHGRRADQHSSRVTYLYNLRPGRSDLSYGTQCAAMNGVPGEIVGRATDLARLAREGEDLVAICSASNKEDFEELSLAESAARLFMDCDLEPEMTREDLLSALDDMLGRDIDEISV